MSKISIKGADTGTGVFTLESPATNTNRTLTIPDVDGSIVTADASGNVGVGTSSPDGKLDIESSTSNHLFLTRTGVGAYSFGVGASNVLQISNDGSERARIDSDGNLLVGTTVSQPAAASKPGNIVSVFSGSSEYGLNITTNTSGTSTLVWFGYSGYGTVGTISTNATTTSYNTTSDYRLKEDWQPMTGATERVKALKPVNFAWKIDGSRVDGFLAHEAQAVVPEAVTGEKDAVELVDIKDEDGNVTGQEERPVYQGIDQSKLVPLLTAALQEALARIQTLEADVATLKGNA